jgi:hypothetical protein
MKTKIALLLATCLVLVGCLTPGQQVVAAGVGAGEGIGAVILKSHMVNGVVDPTYLASYEAEIPNVAGLMQGKITPADLNKILANAGQAGLNSQQMGVVGLLNGVTGEFIKVNGGATPSPDGQAADGAAKQVAVGLGQAVGLVTGTNYVPGSNGY